MEILKGHISPETAVVVNDYPYGFKLRCRIRYWLEFRKGKGFRFVSQTDNPKAPGRWICERCGSTVPAGPGVGQSHERADTGETCNGPVIAHHPWNKPKASTYCDGPAVIVREPNGYIDWRAQRFDRMEADEAQATLDAWRDALPDAFIPTLERFIRVKRRYRELVNKGVPFQLAARQAVIEEAKASKANAAAQL